MFKEKLSNNRVMVKCWVGNRISIPFFVVDTGALYTCCDYTKLGTDIREQDCLAYESKLLTGLDDSTSIKYYKYPLDLMYVGNINLGRRDIWITFDHRARNSVVGFDILKDLSFLYNNQTGYMYFFESYDHLTETIKDGKD